MRSCVGTWAGMGVKCVRTVDGWVWVYTVKVDDEKVDAMWRMYVVWTDKWIRLGSKALQLSSFLSLSDCLLSLEFCSSCDFLSILHRYFHANSSFGLTNRTVHDCLLCFTHIQSKILMQGLTRNFTLSSLSVSPRLKFYLSLRLEHI